MGEIRLHVLWNSYVEKKNIKASDRKFSPCGQKCHGAVEVSHVHFNVFQYLTPL